METQQNFWKKCSSCKNPIDYSTKYYVCSVSTCNGQRTGYVFCSVPCFERHLPGARHKDAAAMEEMSPTKSAGREPVRTIVRPAGTSGISLSQPVGSANVPREVLVIASRLKEFVAAKADMNTSASVMDVLSDHLRVICERGIDNARADGRKTLMDRDFSFLKSMK